MLLFVSHGGNKHMPWNHLSLIPGHPLQADIDCSNLPNRSRFVLRGDFDGDGRQEIAFNIDAPQSGGNDFWVMKYNPANRTWSHLSPIPGHPLQADLDCSGLPNRVKIVGSSIDLDGDGRQEMVICIDAPQSGGNDFWVMKYNPANRTWSHLSQIPGHPLQADFDCSGIQYPARSAVGGDFDGDGRQEIAIAIDAPQSGGNDFWVMKYNPANRTWSHLSQIPGHPLQADLDCSGLPNRARIIGGGDFDGDRILELIVNIDAPQSGGNDFWVMKYNPANRTWSHLSQIPGHPLQADFDCSGLPHPAYSYAMGDFDGDGRHEIAINIDAPQSGGNDFWVMKYNPANRTWSHLSQIPGHPLQADFDCSWTQYPIGHLTVGDYDGDGRHEIPANIYVSGSAGNDFWVMKYNPANRTWSHLSPIPGHPLQADFDCSGLPNYANLSYSGDYDGDGRHEILIGIDAPDSGGNDFWVMKYNT